MQLTGALRSHRTKAADGVGFSFLLLALWPQAFSVALYFRFSDRLSDSLSGFRPLTTPRSHATIKLGERRKIRLEERKEKETEGQRRD